MRDINKFRLLCLCLIIFVILAERRNHSWKYMVPLIVVPSHECSPSLSEI